MQDHPSSSMSPSNTHNSETWKAYWKEQGQPWRTEPTIDEERQQELLNYYKGVVDIERGMYPLYALIISIISFHGRGFFPGGFLPTFPMAAFAACEAIIGLTIEISFIATFTQSYFGQ